MTAHRSVFALVLATLSTIAPLAAQQPAAAQAAAAVSCPIELMQPQQLGIANLQRTKVLNAKTDAEAIKAIQEATKLLFDARAASNALGRDYLLAQFYALAIEHGGEVQTRGALGLPGDKAANIDLLVAFDSLLTIVEKGNPQCKKDVDEWRQYKPYMANIQNAYKALGANKFDDAEKMASRALILYKEGPQPYDVLWRTAKAKNNAEGVVKNLQSAVEKLAGDTLNDAVRANLMFNLGREQQDFGQAEKDPAKKQAFYRGSAAAYVAVAKEYPSSEEAPFALNGIQINAAVLKDESLNTQVLDLVKGLLDKFSDVALAQAGVLATRASKTLDAVTLFGEASKKNPYSRDYLYNYAAMLYEAHRPSVMVPVVKQLVALDPANPDNLMLFAYAYKGFADTVGVQVARVQKDSATRFAKADVATKKLLRDSVAFHRNIQKALIDTVNAWGKQAEDMPYRLAFTSVDRLKEKTNVEGEIENRSKVARTYTIELDFLGKDGASQGKVTATTESVAAGQTGKFKAELPKGGVLGVKYAPLPLK